MSKKLLALFLAIIMVIGTMPVLALVSSAKQVKTNIALGKDTETGTGGSGASAVDGNTGSYVDIPWTNDFDATQTPNEQCWVTVDLGEVTDIVGIGIANYQSSGRYYHFDVYGSTDNENWTLLCQKTTDEAANATFTYDVTASVRYVKEVGTFDSANGGYHFAEIQVFVTEEAPVTTYEIPNSSVTATFDGDTLTFSGTGEIPNFAAVADLPYADIKSQVVKVVFESGITSIGKFTCNTFGALDEIVIPEGVTHIDYDCFAHSGTISKVYLPTTLTSIAQGAFYSCTVNEVYYDDTSRDFGERCTLGGYNSALTNATWVNDPDWGASGDLNDSVAWAFDAETGTLTITGTGEIPAPATKPWQSYVGQIKNLVIGEGLTSIPSGIVSNVTSLETVTMPDTVTKIGGDAFAYCGTISYLRLSSNVTTISQGVLFGSTVTTISCKKDWRAIQQQASIGAYNDAFGNAEWVDVEIEGSYFSFGKYGSGMEIWSGDTQILIGSPKWDGEYSADFTNALKAQQWTLKFEAVDGSESPTISHIYYSSIYDGGTWCILRFVPAAASEPEERFVPTPGKDYKITATVTYQGKTETVTSAETFKLAADATPVTYDTFYKITWTIDGVTEYTENVAEGKTPVYRGAAASYTEGSVAYVANIPTPVAATADATYNITYTATDMTSGALNLWGAGYENWSGQTQLLLCPVDWEGNNLPIAIFNNAADYTWIVTIDGVEYDVKPSSNYSNVIARFEPCRWATPYIPARASEIAVELTIKDGEGSVIYRSAAPAAIRIAADFIPVHEHETGVFTWNLVDAEQKIMTATYTVTKCTACGLEDYVVNYSTETEENKITVTSDENGDVYTVTVAETGKTETYTAARADADVTGDGEIAIDDVSALLDILAGVATAPDGANYDLDGDGALSVSDVSALLDIIANLA